MEEKHSPSSFSLARATFPFLPSSSKPPSSKNRSGAQGGLHGSGYVPKFISFFPGFFSSRRGQGQETKNSLSLSRFKKNLTGMFALRERRVHVTQEDFEMAVPKVMRKDGDKSMSLRKLWK